MKICKLLAALLAVLLLPAGQAMAAPAIDLKKDVQLEVILRDDGAGLENAHFSLYRVADVSKKGKLTPVAPFDRYNVNLEAGSESEMAGAAAALEGYVLRDSVEPAQTALTDAFGDAKFPGAGEKLKPGLYLVLGSPHYSDGYVYTIQPALVQLPLWDAANEKWSYDVIVSAKYDCGADSPDYHAVTRKVLKVWNTGGQAVELPQEVVVHLLRDGAVYDTVTLNADNVWRHVWQDLDGRYHWTVSEEVVADYSVTVQREGITFVVTNTYDPDEPEPPPPPPKPDDPTLPQTGQMWWPVGMLAFAGLLLIVLGLLRRRGD